MRPHPQKRYFAGRLRRLGGAGDVRFDGELYRFINPAFSKSEDIVSGAGAQFASGRWNSKGAEPVSYTALTPETALAEVLANARYYNLPLTKALPRVLVGLHLTVDRALDLTNAEVRQSLRLSLRQIQGLDWRRENQQGKEALTQAWGAIFQAEGYEAVLVPSAAQPKGTNVLVFPRNLASKSLFKVETELAKN